MCPSQNILLPKVPGTETPLSLHGMVRRGHRPQVGSSDAEETWGITVRCQRDRRLRDGRREGRRGFQPTTPQSSLESQAERGEKTETECEFVQTLGWKQSSRAEVLKQRERTCQSLQVPVCQA